MKQKKIGVLMGGLSEERDISLVTGRAVLDELLSLGYNAVGIDVDANIESVLKKESIEVAFLALHGRFGEDGTIQGLLEYLKIPYTGSDLLSSALSMDKVKSKELFRLHNLPTAPYYQVTQAQLKDMETIHGSFGFPVFVKPRRGGSSIASGKADNFAQLLERIKDAHSVDTHALVERFITGKELAIAVLDGEALGAIEIVPKSNFYDFNSKYQKGQSEYFMPPRVAPTRYKGILNMAEQAHKALGASGATRIDMLVTEGENEYILELNTIPGMTKTSLLPKIAEAAGISFSNLCEMILERATLGPRVEAALSRATTHSVRPTF